MANEPRPRSEYDLEERISLFGEAVIGFAKKVPATAISREIIAQLIRSATSAGANYCEADEAESSKEFRYRISVCKKESEGNKVSPANARHRGAERPRQGPGTLAGSQGTDAHFRSDHQ